MFQSCSSRARAHAAAELLAGIGRAIGDLNIMVPRKRLDEVQEPLLECGWEWVKEDAYDDLYYRRWMNELPPLIHRERDRMIDVHHTILPLTAHPKPGCVSADPGQRAAGEWAAGPCASPTW